MAQTKTGFLRFKAPTGETVEYPQEEVQSLRRAGFTPEAGQSLLLRNASGGVSQIPVERLSRVSPDVELSVPTQQRAFQSVAEERYGGAGGALGALLYGGTQGLSSGFGGAGLIESGAVDAETLAMTKAAQPVASFIGEAAGMLGQAALTGSLGTVARGARGAAAATEAAQVARAGGARFIGGPAGLVGLAAQAPAAAAKAAPTLGRAVAGGAAREAAAGALYGAGSEITEAKIEGREARPGEAALTTGLVGGTLGAAFPAVARGLGAVKGAAQRLGAEKIVESETLRAAQIAKAEQKLASARTAEERAAAREQIRTLRDAEKAAAKAAEQDIKNDVATKLDDAAMRGGEDAQQWLQAHRELIRDEVDGKMAGVGDALELVNATDARLQEMGFKGVGSAKAKLTEDVRSLGAKLQKIGADIKARDGIGISQEALGAAKDDYISAVGAAREQKSLASARAAGARQEMTNLRAAGAREARIQAVEEKLLRSEAEEKLYADHLNALEEAGGALHNYNQIAQAGRSLADKLGMAEAGIAKETGRAEALGRQLDRMVPDELRHTSEAAASGMSLTEAMARRMGLAPALGELVPTVGSRDRAFKAGLGRLITKDATEQMLTSAARTGGEEFIDTMLKLGSTGMRKPQGIAIPRDLIGSSPADMLMWLSSEDGARALASLNASQRARVIADVLPSLEVGAKSRAGVAKQEVIRLLRRKGEAIPLTVPENEVQAALMRAQEGASANAAPAAAFSAAKAEKRSIMQGERQAAEVVRKKLETTAADLKTAIESNTATLAKRAEALEAARTKAKVTGYEKTMAAMGQRQEALARELEQAQSLGNKLAQAEQKVLSTLQGKAPVGQQQVVEAQQAVTAAVNTLQEARLAREMALLTEQAGSVEAELSLKRAQLAEIMGGDGITGIAQIRQDAGAVIDAFRQYAGNIGKIEKSAITGKYYAPGQEKIVERSMQEYMRTPEGKKLAAAMAAADKAQASKAAREVEAGVRAAAGVPASSATSAAQAAKDAFTDPAVIAATVMGGPGAGIGVIAAMVASRSGKGGIRQMLTSMSPLFFYQSLERIAAAGQRMAMAPIARTAGVVAASKIDQVSRQDVKTASAQVDEILREQENARNAFSLTAQSTRFPVVKLDELERQYNTAIGQLQRMRPKTMGTGAVSAEEEDFVRAFRLVTDPGALSRAFEQGTLTAPQAALLQKVSPQAYSSLEHIAKVVHDERPDALSPRLRSALNITVSQSDGGLSVGQTQKLMGKSEETQQPGESLGTARPSSAKNNSLSKNAALVGQDEP